MPSEGKQIYYNNNHYSMKTGIASWFISLCCLNWVPFIQAKQLKQLKLRESQGIKRFLTLCPSADTVCSSVWKALGFSGSNPGLRCKSKSVPGGMAWDGPEQSPAVNYSYCILRGLYQHEVITSFTKLNLQILVTPPLQLPPVFVFPVSSFLFQLQPVL